MAKIKSNSNMKDLLSNKAKKDGKVKVDEVHGWSADRDDWNIVGGKIDPNKQYCAVKLWSGSGYLLDLFITEYHDYIPDMVKEVYDAFHESHPKCFPSIDDYYAAVEEWKKDLIEDKESGKYTWTSENDTEDDIQSQAEELAEESILPMWDYDGDVCIRTENAFFSKPMSGAEVEKKLSEL